MNIKIGQGYDVHELVENRELIIGGVNIPHDRGLLGHSDADVLLHAITDAIIGALGLGDIGHAFPDTNPEIAGIASTKILSDTYGKMIDKGFVIGNVDATIMAEQPKMKPHLAKMKKNIAQILHTSEENINVKATTTEKLGFVGREEGMACEAVVLIVKS
ncbi:2-C-methyl-D-erythritol 2,4-cyclodiphosphate synthase [Floricoccus penangensis]|uniref:2-C-methyl-D-erythritol 2,4-cyclodiphosphate synthase n=1 Tax=Floricoccus penangensis TaxID=1859475 RepID=A0A9Q5P085_9LACT|nr:2-C-methyl-D-erythritol 2,4-cyclodiphosphate synthase [Floricoccus penangensis]OFI47253.1 2-C-methyl-D-erythritol 2,4-cyclodiphosphate synthase [Floricoccus penangensis]URZ87289.1 2-C-methyl-D-erythritol 2,4-cyclodiphosphate synthase [Floricoccus penangensis]